MAAIAHRPLTSHIANLWRPARRKVGALALVVAAMLQTACAPMHPAIAALPWQDQWGDRGTQVLARDHAMCGELVEQRRSQLPDCLRARGWALAR
jgi:hypothetical protein